MIERYTNSSVIQGRHTLFAFGRDITDHAIRASLVVCLMGDSCCWFLCLNTADDSGNLLQCGRSSGGNWKWKKKSILLGAFTAVRFGMPIKGREACEIRPGENWNLASSSFANAGVKPKASRCSLNHNIALAFVLDSDSPRVPCPTTQNRLSPTLNRLLPTLNRLSPTGCILKW